MTTKKSYKKYLPAAFGILLTLGSGAATSANYQDAVNAVLALPYDATAVPTGLDSAFGSNDYPAAFPLTDTTTGDCCTGPVPDQPALGDLAPPFAEFPGDFNLIELASHDGTPFHAYAALRPGAPAIVVMHGFNTNGKYSIVRYGANLYANGYSVIVPDHRDMGREWTRGGSWHPSGTRRGQTLGWKEAQDLLTAVRWLKDNDATKIGVAGFSEGAQNTILTLGIDYDNLIDTVITFSGPADQQTLALRNAQSTSALLTTVVNNGDICNYLSTVGALPEFAATPNFALANASAVDTLDGILGGGVTAPGLHFYTDDDTLVPSWNATILASRTNFMAQQHTVLLPLGNHAYFVDRYWQQLAMLTWFQDWLDPDAQWTTTTPTVAQPPNGTPVSSQQIDLSGVTQVDGDDELRTDDVCPAGVEIGPTALLRISNATIGHVLDGRRSYSGWEDHTITQWSLNTGDGGPLLTGADVRNAYTNHTYCAAGTYTVTLTVTDDTGNTATTQTPVEVTVFDTDSDGTPDCSDNCLLVSNPTQCDTNLDGLGNRCDPDLDNNGIVNSFDLSIMRNNFGASGSNDADLDCNNIVNSFDLTIMRSYFGLPPGPGS